MLKQYVHFTELLMIIKGKYEEKSTSRNQNN